MRRHGAASDASSVKNRALRSPDRRTRRRMARRVCAGFRRARSTQRGCVCNQLARRLRVASASVSSTGSVCVQLTHASVMDTP
ncbi:hypothetical protein C8K18_110132 [Paraburkholderia sp. GV068]|nr:hypothetical protein [Paraburkholderia graminis]PTQ96033.1 hypothetical protein C8K19_111132 [Paraburkholderia sp. GV072]PUB02371.1 hypothetical protein C8K18_110132 [Paraburkholderia sp. GV068]CAB3667477.1 hypothetical protein R8871_01849 [Paraburkholderia graminis C4D1M]